MLGQLLEAMLALRPHWAVTQALYLAMVEQKHMPEGLPRKW